MRRLVAIAALLALTGCSTFKWPEWASFDDSLDFEEYTERPRSYMEIALEHDFLVRVKPWERGVLSRSDMSRSPRTNCSRCRDSGSTPTLFPGRAPPHC